MITATFMIVIAYLLGSLSSAILVCKFMGLPDPRGQGSGNPGATNILRLGGKVPAAITLAGDVLKGFIPVLIAAVFGVRGFFLGAVGLAAFLGHLYPLYFKFKGGKGVATAFGAIFALSFLVGIAAGVTWFVVAAISRYASLAAIVAAILAPIYTLIFGDAAYFVPILIMTGFIIWRHWTNIQRLRTRTEDKIKL